MDVRLVLASLLLLSVTATAQGNAKPAAAAPATPAATPAAPAAPDPGKQDPDKPAPKPTDVISELTREKERLQSEIEYARTRAKSAHTMLAAKLSTRGQTFKSVDAGTSAAAPAPAPVMRKARLMDGKELEGQPQDVMLMVNGRPVRQGQFDELMAYLKTSPSSGDDSLRAQRVLFDLIRTQSVVAAFPENPAEGQVGDVLGQLETGKPIAELAQSVGTVQGAQPDGSVEVTRNSFLGTKLEQVAFTVAVGKHSRPFHTPHGLAIVQVDSVEKGASPELDKVKAHVLQVPWQAEAAAVQKAQAAAASGQVDILVRDQKVMDMLPVLFKPADPAQATERAFDGADNEVAALMDTLKQIDAMIAKLNATGTEEAKSQLKQLEGQRQQVQAAIDELRKKTDANVDAPQPVTPAPGAPNVPKKPDQKK